MRDFVDITHDISIREKSLKLVKHSKLHIIYVVIL